MRNLFREISAIWRFFRKTPKAQKTIVFYAEHEGYWSYLEGLIRELINTEDKTISYITSDPNDPIFSREEPGIKPFYLNKLLPYFMVFVSAKVFVMTMTDLHRFYIRRSINPAHYVYVFHALMSTHMAYLEGAFDHYDTIFCTGPYQVDEILKREKEEHLPKKHLVKTGYYRLERIYDAYQKRLGVERFPNRKVILIAPSWGKENVFETCGEKLIASLLKAGYEVIARPHPELKKRSPELLKSFVKMFGGNPLFTLETSVATDDSLLRADLLVSDCSGVALEYAFGTEKPVLFIDVPPKMRNSNYRKLGIEPLELALRSEIGVIVSPKDIETIDEAIEKLIASRDLYKERIQRLREKHIYEFGRSSKVGAEYILDLLTK